MIVLRITKESLILNNIYCLHFFLNVTAFFFLLSIENFIIIRKYCYKYRDVRRLFTVEYAKFYSVGCH